MGTPPPPKNGDLLEGRYLIQEEIGRGGQSVVFRGLDTLHGDEVALKVLKQDVRQDPNAVERMFREALAMTQLSGTSALRVLDQAWTETGCLCLVTELIHGVDLSRWLNWREKREERLTVAAVSELIEPVVATLSAAHRAGIVHRDLKPANIFVVDPSKGGGVRLIDFGFAKFVRMPGFTASNLIAGSPSYIAPEAWAGRREDLDQRLDVYALGAILFRALAGVPPFHDKSLPELHKAVTTAERPLLTERRPDLPPAVDAWTRSALAIEPSERFQTVDALWNAFRIASSPKSAQ